MAEVSKPLVTPHLLNDPRSELIQRIAASDHFAKSPRLRQLLFYLADWALRNPDRPITEHQLGVAVFNRPPGYDTAADTVVRVQASEIRKRLKYYFLSEGLHEPMAVELPRGRYRLEFHSPSPQNPELAAGECISLPVVEIPVARRTLPDRAASPEFRRAQVLSRGLVLFLIVVMSLCAWLAYQNTKLRTIPATATPYLRHFWTQFFQNGQTTEVVPGDSALILLADILGRNIPLQQYVQPDYPKALLDPLIKSSRESYYVSRAAGRGVIAPYDASVLHRLSLLSERYQLSFRVTAAREAGIDSSLPDNLILLGHKRANPWLELFESRMNFRHLYDDSKRRGTIFNLAPLPGEKSSYVIDNHQEAYAVVACLPRAEGNGNVLILFGGNLATIEGAAQLVTDEATMAKLHSRLGVGLSGRLPYFEVLLEKPPTAQKFEVIAHRIISPNTTQ